MTLLKKMFTACKNLLTFTKNKVVSKTEWMCRVWNARGLLIQYGRNAYYLAVSWLLRTWATGWPWICAVLGLSLMAVSIYLTSKLQGQLVLLDARSVSPIQTFLVTIGGSFVGATAIVSAMLMYALQVNVERMPHRLFRRFGTDPQILLAFFGTFLLAGFVAALSAYVSEEDFVRPLVLAGWGAVWIVALFWFAYRRTLDLVSPNFQLIFLLKQAKKSMARWEKYADRAANSGTKSQVTDEEHGDISLDLKRLQFFNQFPHWTVRANESLFYSLNFASRYAQQGDFSVVTSAHGAVVAIHGLYIKARGRTFVSANGLIESPLSNDALLSDTLESLRQVHREAIAQGNERFIVANLQVMANLAELYLQVDYASKYVTSKSHANLAAHYLADSIKEVLPHNRPDVLMKGIRLLGRHALQCAVNEGLDNIPQLSEKISELALIGVVHQSQIPVTVTAIEQLGQLTFGLLRSNSSQDLRFSLHEVRRDIHKVAMLVVERTKDELLGNRHGNALGGIYSATSLSAFPGMLTELTNQLLAANESDKNAQRIIRNIETWSDQLYQSQKELLLAAVAARSSFVFDMVYWIVTVTQVLALLAKADACPKHSRDELERASNWLISTLSWIPDDKDTASQIAHYSVHERLFECAMKLYHNGCVEVAITASSELVSSAFRFGRYENGWARLEESLHCVAVLSLRPELQESTSVEKLSACLAKYPISTELRDRTARSIRSESLRLHHAHHSIGVRHAMSREDPKDLSNAMLKIANLLSPETANEPIQSHYH